MEKRLNLKRINSAMDELGLNQAGLSKKLAVSRTIVSSWFKGSKFPRPDKLLKLGIALGLPFQDLVEKSIAESEPVVAFRKKAARKTKEDHIKQAKEMGQLLELLVPYIPNDRMFQPPALKNPRLQYRYIQKAASKVRQEIGVHDGDPVAFEQLIRKINEFEVILIPVFHGNKENHENALHIFLPSSNTTWIYLNLDSHVHDFKFWMAHELGHTLAPSLMGDAAEDFADSFAQALLFPEDQAEKAYKNLLRIETKRSQINKIIDLSEKLIISPVTVYKSVNNYAIAHDLPVHDLAPDIYAAAANLNKDYPKISESLADQVPITVTNYIEITEKIFNSPFFHILGIYLSENEKSSGFIQAILDISILDAKEIHAELVK